MDHRRRRYIEILVIATVAALIFKIVNNVQSVTDGVGAVLSYIMASLNYFIWGFVIAYFMNPLLIFLEKRKFPRAVALPVIYVVVLGLIFLFVFSIYPVAVANLTEMISQLQVYINNANTLFIDMREWVTQNLSEDMVELFYQLQDSVTATLRDLLNYIAKEPVTAVSSTISYLSNAVMLVFFSLILSIYMLWEKESVSRALETIATAVLGVDRAKHLISAAKKTNIVFSSYVTGKVLDSFIIMILMTFGFFWMNIPYASFFGILNGIMNMIPYFGPFISGVPTVLIVLFIDPIKAFWSMVFIVVVQQVDGWIIAPKIIGNKMGISTLLLLVSVLLGQQFMGLMGMFIGVPICAAIKLLVYDEYLLPRAQRSMRLAHVEDESASSTLPGKSHHMRFVAALFNKILTFIKKVIRDILNLLGIKR